LNAVTLGLMCGLGFGAIDVAMMVPLKYDNKRRGNEAMAGAFIERFMLGFIIPNMALGIVRHLVFRVPAFPAEENHE